MIYAGPDEEYVVLRTNETALSIAEGWISEDHRFFFVNDEGDELDGTVTEDPMAHR